MSENRADYILISHQLGKNPEEQIAEKLRDAAQHNNSHGCRTSLALTKLNVSNIRAAVVGPNLIGVLDDSGRVFRLSVEQKKALVEVKEEPTSNSGQGEAAPSAVISSRPSGAKLRRVMLSATSFRREGRGILIERGGGRPMVAASAVPEDLIAQAQVVLQGKSREVIVRELQRTNLNVNEAVNNLLSRDDDDEDGDDSANEVMIPEELLSLLDPASAANHAIVDASEYPGDALEYIFSGRSRAKTEAKEKEKKAKEEVAEKPTSPSRGLLIGDDFETYSLKDGYGPGGKKFIKIACTNSELLALSEDGILYGWKWDEKHGDKNPHPIATSLVSGDDSIQQISACGLRVAVFTDKRNVATWLDHYAVGSRACQATSISSKIPTGSRVIQLSVSNHIAALRTFANELIWCGLYPFSDRPKLWEKERAKSRKHVTFSTESADIIEGSEVKTKSSPVYSAGSVAINLSLGKPMVGVLMESVWSVSEMCRFRVMDAATFDRDVPGDNAEGEIKKQQKGSGRKRRASQDVFEPPVYREEAWEVGSLVWIHEQQSHDSCIVKIVDGAYVGVEYVRTNIDMTYASSQTGSLSSKEGEAGSSTGKMRLMRKDDLCLLTPRMKSIRSPRVMQAEMTKVSLPTSSHYRKLLSVVADSNGFRALVEKRGRLFITRISVSGRIGSERLLHVHSPSLYSANGCGPQLVNYGEDSVLILKDGNGSMIPLVRDAMMGFKEPSPLHLPPLKLFSVGVSCSSSTAAHGAKTEVVRSLTLVALMSPVAMMSSGGQSLPSIIQSVLYCDSNGVKAILDSCDTKESLEKEILHSRTDCGGSVLHAAIRLSTAKKNKDDVDVGATHGIKLREDETRQAREEARDLDLRWHRMLRSRAELEREGGVPVVQGASANESSAPSSAVESSDPSPSRSGQDMPDMEEGSAQFGSPIDDEKLRQKGAIACVEILMKHPALEDILEDLLCIRDASGLTPFQSAINSRAYGAAAFIWNAINAKIGPEVNVHMERMLRMIYPPGSRADDSPLFVLCYNDTCSFTWTGEEHINQDIFECRTCGLTGTLCCCTECAMTCHRNHDCKLKRTSPTAYCDCWEKCPCKALIAGNQEKREHLFSQLLKITKLHEHANNRGEHVLLYLARTIGRQNNEQTNYSKRRRRCIESGDNPNMPEHNLEPPKFAKFALEACLSEWRVIRSAIRIGIRETDNLKDVYEEVLIAHSQHGSTHLDRMVFALFTKCGEQVITNLIPTLIKAANEEKSRQDPAVDQLIFRLVRSIIRIYLLCMLLSPTAASTAICGKTIADHNTSTPERKSYISIGGLFSIVRGEHKDTKFHAVGQLISRFRAVLFSLPSYAMQQALNVSESLIVPVRLGICRPTMALNLPNNMDPLEYMEKYLNSEADLTSVMSRGDEKEKPGHHKKKKGSHKNDKAKTEKSSQESESDSDSDGDGHSSRRHNSQSGMEDTADSAQASTPRRKIGISEVYMNDEDDSGDSSSLSDSDEEEEEGHVMVEDDENVDEDETEDDERDNVNGEPSEGDQDQSAVLEGDADTSQDNEDAEPVLEDTFRIEDDDESREAARDESNDVDNSENRESNSDEDVLQRFDVPSSGDEHRIDESVREAAPLARVTLDPRYMARRNRALQSSLNWRARRLSDEEDGWEDLDVVQRDRVPPNDRAARRVTQGFTRAPPSSQVNTGTAATPSDQPGTPSESCVSQTTYQMARMFNYTLRLMSDLLPALNESQQESPSLSTLHVSQATLRSVMANVLGCLESTWVWMTALMDRLESQLLFQNGVLMATNMTEPRLPSNHTKKKESKKEKGDEVNNRRDAMEYFLTSMRSCSKEAGDNFPIIDMELLHNLAFVFDSFMVYKFALERSKKAIRKRNCTSSPSSNDAIQRQKLKEFFERSNPRAFCGPLTSNAWDTLSSNTSFIPLASNSALLTPWSENDALYAPYSPLTNWNDYEEAAQRLGLDAKGMSNSLYNFNDNTLPRCDSDLSDNDEEMPEEQSEPTSSFDEEIVKHPDGVEPVTVDEIKEYLKESIHKPANYVLSRWKNVLYIMAKDCAGNITEAFGGEDGNSFLITTVAGHTFRFARFKKIMDQYRAAQTRDLTMEVHRDPNQLIRDTVFDLNQTYVRRINLPKTKDDGCTPMSCGKVKIKFHDEPGEGTGVARSYYTALAEALQNNHKLPFDEYGWSGSDDYLFGGSGGARPSAKKGGNARDRERHSISRIAVIRERGTSTILGRKRPSKRQQLSACSKPYVVEDTTKVEAGWQQFSAGVDRSSDESVRDKKVIADVVYLKVAQLRPPPAASRIAGMLVDLPLHVVVTMLATSELLKQYVDDAVTLMLQSGMPSDLALLSANKIYADAVGDHPESDEAPLFIKTSKSGGYVPNPGKLSPIRLNVFRNVGRMIGLCLLQGELFPLKLARHAIKYILGNSLNWLDLQYFDYELFDSLRKGLLDNNTEEYFEALQLTFVANVPSPENPHTSVTVELKPDGANISVTPLNVLEYLYRFIEVRMLSADTTKCLKAMQDGVFDAIPAESLSAVNPDDLRLLMCGTEQVNISILQEMTTFSDESHSSKDTIDKFKEWFWSVVDDLSDADKQELVFFWTGSPSLSTMAEVVHPQPTVMIRPPDDLYLPTANTCISRLYVPLYSSKKVLKSKLSIAIKAKNFGFV